MNHQIRLFLFLFLWSLWPVAKAQVSIQPAGAGMNDTVTIVFNAAAGNAALLNFNGPVYMHTGLITPLSTGPNDWKNVVGNWAQADSNVLMVPLGNNIYTKRVHLASYYGVNAADPVNFLAFVFRNANGSVVGRSGSNNDILVPLQVFQPGNYVSHSVQGNRLQIQATQGVLLIDRFSAGVRVQLQSDSLPTDSSYAVLDSLLVPLNFTVNNLPHFLQFAVNGQQSVLVRKTPLGVFLLRGADTIFAEQAGWEGTSGGIKGSFRLHASEAYFGGGFRTQDLNLRGKRFNLYNQAQYGYSNGAMNLNISIPFFISSRGYGILFDNHRGGVVDLGNSDNAVFSAEFEGGPMRYWLVPGSNYKQLLENYTALTGRQELPPLWSLGYIQSRYGYQTEVEARNVVTQMQQQDFPLSALVLDLFWFGSPATMGNLQWDNTRFPNPTGMISDWRNSGVKTILITETYFTQNSSNFSSAASNGYFATTPAGQPYIIGGFWAGSSALLDLTKPSVRPWFMNFYQQRALEGVEGWWCDLGEPENHPSEMRHFGGSARQIHNIYSLLWAEWLHTHYKQQYPNKRLFNLIRSGYSGMQRYSTFPWTGDIQRSWGGLQAQIPAMIHMGMSGVGYMHSDIGGFTGGGQDNELYARWQQLGAFQPIQRAHGEGVPTEPIFYPNNIKAIVRDFAKLRMRLLPYNYTLAWENSQSGLPLVRPLFLELDGFSSLYSQVNDQFLWGKNLLVAPVMAAGQTSRPVVLPPGRWFEWWTDQAYNGGATVSIAAPLSRMPLLVRGDAFVPMTPAVNSTEQYSSDTLEVHYYPADSSKTALYTLFLDDGSSRNSLATNQFRTMAFTGRHGQSGGARLWVQLVQQGSYAGEPTLRNLQFQVHRFALPADAQVFAVTGNQHAALALATSLADFNNRDSVYWYDAAKERLYVKYTIDGQDSRLEVGAGTVSDGPPHSAASGFYLRPPYPNPFSDAVTISADVYEAGEYVLEISDLYGRLVHQQSLYQSAESRLQYQWDAQSAGGGSLANGLYMVRLRNKQFSLQARVLLQR
jgi:alpha-glucosidase (family GH31 glycosyl hydrolase)